jgi:acetyl esterase
MTSTRTPMDADYAALLESLGGVVIPPARTQTPQQIRDIVNETLASLDGPDYVPEIVGTIEDAVMESADARIPIRVYTPVTGAPRAVIAYFHGGGWVAGDLDTHDKICRRLANGTSSVVVATDYRLAPEHPFPAAFVDCLAGAAWAAERYPDLPLIVAGDSAGGALAATVAQRSRDTGSPLVTGQVLIYPAINMAPNTPSMELFADGYLLTRDDCVTYYEWYLPDSDRRSMAYAVPSDIDSVAGLAPAVVVTAGFDPLLDEGNAYARRLADAGVPVVHQTNPALLHGFIDVVTVVPAAAEARERIVEATSELIDRLTHAA